MHDLAAITSETIGIVVFGTLGLHFLWAGYRISVHSTRLANFSLFCVVVHQAVFQMNLHRKSPSGFVIGACLVLGLLSVGFAMAAVIRRRRAAGGIIRPIVALVLSLAQLLSATGSVMFITFTRSSGRWIYHSPDAEYSIVLPSDRWHQGTSPENLSQVWFACAIPPMQAAVVSVRHQQSEGDFANIVEQARARLESTAERRDTLIAQHGVNSVGNSYNYFTAVARDAEGRQLPIAHCLTWIPAKRLVVQVLIEAPMTFRSTEGQAAATNAFEQASDTICRLIE
jgi:hypothetical protein